MLRALILVLSLAATSGAKPQYGARRAGCRRLSTSVSSPCLAAGCIVVRVHLSPPAAAWPDISWDDLKPYQNFKHNHEFYYQVGWARESNRNPAPANPRETSLAGPTLAWPHWRPTVLSPGACTLPPRTALTRNSRRSTWQVPKNPKGAVFLAHGCVHSAYNFWPQSEACPECRGLPEELSHTLQALKLGYAGEGLGGTLHHLADTGGSWGRESPSTLVKKPPSPTYPSRSDCNLLP
jgi:hypothetical protein